MGMRAAEEVWYPAAAFWTVQGDNGSASLSPMRMLPTTTEQRPFAPTITEEAYLDERRAVEALAALLARMVADRESMVGIW